jgi:hypothetical protein
MAQKNRANMLTDIVSNIYNNLINFITGQNAQDRFVNLLDSSPNILSDASQPNGYVSTDANNEMFSSYYDEEISRADLISDLTANLAVGGKFYRINDAVGSTITLLVTAESNINLYPFGIDATTGEIGTYDITTDVFSPIVSSAQTLSDTLILGNTSGANDIEFDATQGLLFANTSRLREGTIDAGLGGLKGIAQICGAGYELKWENGRLYVMGSSGNTIRQSLYNLTTTPTVTDDDTLGYSVGSLWTLDDGTVYVCSDATTGAAVWAIGGIPTIQQVLDAGDTSTTPIIIDDGAGNSVTISTDLIKFINTIGGTAQIKASALANNVNFEIPNKPAGTETFAMLSDIASWDSTLVSTSLTAALSTQYVVVASATFTDPTPVEGKGFQVYVRNGTATIGGVGYSVAGSVIWRVFHSGSWATYLINGMTNPMTTGGDIIYGGSSGAPTRLANGTAGQILQSNGTTLAPSWVAAPSGGTNTYSVNVQSFALASPVDATSYHFGIIGDIMATTTLRREFKFPQAGTMTAFSFNLLQATNGSNETCTLYLRNTTTSTDYTIGTFTSDFGLNGALKTLYSGLSIAVNTTDNWAVKITTPTWGTNPTNWITNGLILITT